MAIKKVQLPDNSTQDINDSRIASTDITNWNGKEDTTNKVTSLSASSTDTQYPSAKVVYDELEEKVSSLAYDDIVSISKTDFDALTTKNTRTLYVVDDPNGGGSSVVSALLRKTTYTSSDTTVSSLAWDTLHLFPELAELTVSSFASEPSDGYEHELAIVFDTPSNISNFSLGVPNTLHWANNIDLAQNISASTRYEVRISSSSMIAVYTETALS